MIIGGFEKFSLIDYPGKMCAVVFTQGCNFKCPYCHNSELVKPELFFESIPEDDIFLFLSKREFKLDAVTISGGEPTIQAGLLKFMQRLKNMNFLVKLDTNGSNPKVLERAIKDGIVDFIAMDIKAPLWRYSDVAGADIDISQIEESISLIVESKIEYQFRTTVVPSLLSPAEVDFIDLWMRNTKSHVFQKFIPSKKILDPSIIEKEEVLSLV